MTFLIPTITLIALTSKWFILHKIHNEIVEKYHKNSSLTYDSHAICHVFDYNKFNIILFPISCLLIVLFAFEHRRISFKVNRFHGHLAPPVPLDFFSRVDRKIAVITFAICANELLEIINQTVFGSSLSTENGIILVYLQRIVQVLAMGFRYYPVLVAVYRNSFFSLTLGTLYIWIEFPITVIQQSMCQPKYYLASKNGARSNTELLLDYYGTGPFLIVIELITDIPGYLCLAYIFIKLPSILFNKILQRHTEISENQILTHEEKSLIEVINIYSVEMLYIKNLDNTNKQRLNYNTFFNRVIPKAIYEWRDDFRFSSRILCVYSSVFLLLYFTLIQTCIQILPYMGIFQQELQEIIDIFFKNSYNNQSHKSFPLPHFVRPFLLAVGTATLIIIVQLCLLLTSIRRNLLQAFRGDDCEVPRRQRSSYVNYAIGNFHFAGYLIGYVVWGLILIVFFAFLFFMCIDLLMTFNAFHIMETILKAVIPILLLYYFKEFLNRILARFVFLQHAGDVLAMNNRRLLMIFLYFNFFLDAFLGLVSSILRLLQSFIGGVIYMSRLDYSPLGRKLETWDDGFSSYCGLIHTECAHRHPVMLVFAGHLLHLVKNNRTSALTKIVEDFAESDIIANKQIQNIQLGNSRRHWIRKWQVAAFLVRNPSIVFFRKAYLNQFHTNDLLVIHRATSRQFKASRIRRRISI